MTDDAAERFELLYRQHFRAVLRYTLARVEPETAKDATAETFLVAWRRLADVPDDPAPWLFGVARKVIAGQLRARSRREALCARLEVTSADEAATGEIVEDVAERAAVLAAFTRLSDNDREVLMLIAWDGRCADMRARNELDRLAAFRVLATLPGTTPIDGGKGLRFDFAGQASATLMVTFTPSGVHTITTTTGLELSGSHLHRYVYSLSVTARWVNRLPK